MKNLASSLFEYENGRKLRRKVRAIIVNERGEFLFIQPHGYDAQTWTLVGGGIEPGESEEIAAAREIREETGISEWLDFRRSTITHRFFFPDHVRARRNIEYDGQAAFLFFVTVKYGAPVTIQQEEIKAYCWVNYEDAKSLLKVPQQRALFADVISEFKEHAVLTRALSQT